MSNLTEYRNGLTYIAVEDTATHIPGTYWDVYEGATVSALIEAAPAPLASKRLGFITSVSGGNRGRYAAMSVSDGHMRNREVFPSIEAAFDYLMPERDEVSGLIFDYVGTTLTCECGANETYVDANPALDPATYVNVKALIEHARYDHMSPRDVLMVAHTVALNSGNPLKRDEVDPTTGTQIVVNPRTGEDVALIGKDHKRGGYVAYAIGRNGTTPDEIARTQRNGAVMLNAIWDYVKAHN